MKVLATSEQKNLTDGGNPEGELLTEVRPRLKRPPKYKVIMLNDDFTPMDFVVFVLKSFFHKTQEEAVEIMLNIHNKGAGLCGVFTRDVAETKIEQVLLLAKQNEHPLRCVMERE